MIACVVSSRDCPKDLLRHRNRLDPVLRVGDGKPWPAVHVGAGDEAVEGGGVGWGGTLGVGGRKQASCQQQKSREE